MYILVYVLNSSLIHNIEIINVLYIYILTKKSQKKFKICMCTHPISIKKIFIHIHNSFLILLDTTFTKLSYSSLLRVLLFPIFLLFKVKTWKFLHSVRHTIVFFFEYFPSNFDFPAPNTNFRPAILD